MGKRVKEDIVNSNNLNNSVDTNDSFICSKKSIKRKILNIRFFTITFFLVVFLVLCFAFASKTIEREKFDPIKYSDVSNVNYKVYLKQNNIYHEDYLEMNRAYVANLIDHIDVDFNYLFNIETITDMTFDYKVVAQLIIENEKGTNFVDEKYVLKDTQSKHLTNSGTQNIVESTSIDYHYYNQLVNQFKTETGVDIVSYLNVYLQVDKKTADNLNYKISEKNKANIKIPLSERAIEINIDSDSKEVSKQVIPLGNVKFNLKYLILESIFFVISCLFLVKFINYIASCVTPKTKFDKYVNKLLKNYDRLIVESNTKMDLEKYNKIDVKSFTELLDVRDNLKIPIVYVNLEEHKRGLFYIKNETEIYRLIVDDGEL